MDNLTTFLLLKRRLRSLTKCDVAEVNLLKYLHIWLCMEMSNIKTIQKSLREIYLFSLLFKKLKNVGNTGSGETLEEIFYLLKEKELQVRPL